MTAAVGPRAILYVRDSCHLCDEFLVDLSLDLGPEIASVAVADVDRDPGLAARYGLRVPVLEVEGKVACEGHYDAAEVRRALQV